MDLETIVYTFITVTNLSQVCIIRMKSQIKLFIFSISYLQYGNKSVNQCLLWFLNQQSIDCLCTTDILTETQGFQGSF